MLFLISRLRKILLWFKFISSTLFNFAWTSEGIAQEIVFNWIFVLFFVTSFSNEFQEVSLNFNQVFCALNCVDENERKRFFEEKTN